MTRRNIDIAAGDEAIIPGDAFSTLRDASE